MAGSLGTAMAGKWQANGSRTIHGWLDNCAISAVHFFRPARLAARHFFVLKLTTMRDAADIRLRSCVYTPRPPRSCS